MRVVFGFMRREIRIDDAIEHLIQRVEGLILHSNKIIQLPSIITYEVQIFNNKKNETKDLKSLNFIEKCYLRRMKDLMMFFVIVDNRLLNQKSMTTFSIKSSYPASKRL